MKLGPKVFPKLFPKQTDTHTPCQTRQQVFLTAEDDTTVARDTINVQNDRTGPETASDDGKQRQTTGNDVGRQETKSSSRSSRDDAESRREVVETVQNHVSKLADTMT